MSRGWLDKADNPGMREWQLTAADRTVRYGATGDFERLHRVCGTEQVRDLHWLDDA